jgi:HK97 family phage prohead protease
MKKEIYSPEKRYFDANVMVEQREGAESREVILRAAVFGKLSKRLSWGFVEKIEEGAFDGADMSDVVACLNHNKDILYARTGSGTLKLETDGEGLKGVFDAPATTAGNDLLVMVQRGDIRKASFEFIVDKDRWVNDPEHGEMRIIEKFRKIYDISPVVFEAYPDTDVAKRSFEEYKKAEEPPIYLDVIHMELDLEYYKSIINY